MNMKRIQYYIVTLCMGIFLLSGCSRDSVDDVEFDVRVKNDLNSIRVGEPVTFLFDGNAEYISFFSGENGNNYAHITRDSVGVADLQIACTIKQQYTDKEYRLKEMVHAYLSQDFSGVYDLEHIQQANWTKISGSEYNQISVPLTVDASTEEVSSTIDMSDFKQKPFYIAFQYNAPKRTDVPTSSGSGRYVVAPRIDVNPLSLTKTTVEGNKVVWDNPSTDWGFRVVYENSTQSSNYSVDDGGLLFQPQQGKEHTDEDVIVWMVSRLIQSWEVEPDRGLPIKSMDAYLPSYSYVYQTPGEYTLTFIATNATLWDSSRIVKQITLTVTE